MNFITIQHPEFYEVDLKLSSNMNIFIGDNGTGKSTIMEYCYRQIKSENKCLFIPSYWSITLYELCRNHVSSIKNEILEDLIQEIRKPDKYILDKSYMLSALFNAQVYNENDELMCSYMGKKVPLYKVSRGYQYLGTLVHLIQTGSLKSGVCLFLDHPEININSKLLKEMVSFFIEVSRYTQLFISTHSLFVMRELEIKNRTEDIEIRYFNFIRDKMGVVEIIQGDNVDEIGNFSMLNLNIEQRERNISNEWDSSVDILKDPFLEAFDESPFE